MTKAQADSRLIISSLLLVLLVLLLALVNLQIIQGDKYSLIAERNFVRIKKLPPIRGEIYDRNYLPIAVNKSSINLYIKPGEIISKDAVSKFVSSNFPIELDKIQAIIRKNRYRLYSEILLIQDVQYDQMVKISEKFDRYPSLFFKTENKREYAYNNHFTGYVSKISEEELAAREEQGYTINSNIGKNGLERYYEEKLRGTSGYDILQVDASGKSLEFFNHNLHQEPVDGADMILTIDNRLQEYIESIMPEDFPGSAVVLNAKTGGVLAYVSKPSFDQNIFIGSISSADWIQMLNNPQKPMLDRVIHGSYPPASVFKTIPALLGLEKNIIDRETKLAECDGGMQVGNRYFNCWLHSGHGRLNVVDAIKFSCDVFFYDLSMQFDLAEMEEFTKQNFLTKRTGVDLPGERRGFFPTVQWYADNYGKHVNILGQKVNLSIGQGEILVTPLQVCAHYATIASNGIWRQPHLMKKFIKDEQEELKYYKELRLPSAAEHLKIIQEALYETVNGRYGTGSAARVADVKVYGKTGSAENHMGETTHAWFAGYAAWEEPEIVFTVFLENAGGGGSVAAPIAREIIEFYQQQREAAL
ncbi:MAG: penicillin-binding protein 2 [Candidatus Cloacimonadales bacterium]